MKADDKSNVLSNSTAEIETINNISSIKENYCVVSSATKPHVDSSNETKMQDAVEVGGNSNSQGEEDYTQLLNQYYEVEEQRQKILQQLHQLGNWNNYFSAEGSGNVQWGTGLNYQECQVPTSQASHPAGSGNVQRGAGLHYQECQFPISQASHPATVCTCCPYISQCSVTPCSLPSCSLMETCVGKTCGDATAAMGSTKQVGVEDADVVKTAMGAAQKAFSSMGMKTSGIPNQNESISCFQARIYLRILLH